MTRCPRAGVLGLQGDFERHARSIEALGVESVKVSLPGDLEDLDALVIPGGESSTMLRLLGLTGLREPVERFVREKPVLGTCAGVILLARESDHLPAPTLGALDVGATRNAYGRQIHSFTGPVDVAPLGSSFPGVFIRAPRLTRVGAGVEVVATRPDGAGGREVVGVRQGNVVGLCFHPELTFDLRLHRWFLGEVAGLAIAADPVPSRAEPA
ncbi:MAG TPA: pyridoxal 5'-phosphate synthase glutaminase subunit PdxT [Candidatus Udaeobacter sp.]|nr:pyridoxal 5'-phosphate synthase glutaminase subunit PdxT [Candidatus Udaeobacter sp.]